jgi:hypothetical protein
MNNIPNRVLHGMRLIFHSLPDFASSPPQRGGSKSKLGDHDTSKLHNPLIIVTYCVEGPT